MVDRKGKGTREGRRRPEKMHGTARLVENGARPDRKSRMRDKRPQFLVLEPLAKHPTGHAMSLTGWEASGP